ncbi:MAG: sensor histidine kinase [Bacteroidales bacterium]|nr:sensor histidine kinase [Bacteroidales bacterium]
MFIVYALLLSVVLQFGATIIALSLLKRTKYSISWILFSIGFLLMALRRVTEVYDLIENKTTISEFGLWIAILTSFFIFLGTIYIKQIFNFQDRIDKIRKESEKRVFSTIIRTEETERQTFAKELHDGLGPILSSIKLAVSAIDKQNIDSKNKAIINQTEHVIDEAIATVKEISNKLSPHILMNFGLEKALKNFSNTIASLNAINIQINSNLEQFRLPFNEETVFYRIVCELLTNTIKYAQATKVEITLYKNSESFELVYLDNGVGFDFEAVKEKGMGFSNIQSRIKSLGGEICIHTSVNEGFIAKLSISI